MEATSNETLWWFLGTDTEGEWHERKIWSPTQDAALSWWIERTGRAPDIAWSARDTLLRIEGGREKLAQWPTLPGVAPPNWFLGWLGHPRGEMTLVAVPAADEEHALLVLASEQPECSIRILGDLSALDRLTTQLSNLIETPSKADVNLFPRRKPHISPELSAWINQQFDMEPSA